MPIRMLDSMISMYTHSRLPPLSKLQLRTTVLFPREHLHLRPCFRLFLAAVSQVKSLREAQYLL